MLVTVRWSWEWCPIGCRTVSTACRASEKTRGTGSLQVAVLLDASLKNPVGQAVSFCVFPHSVLPKLRAVHFLRSHLRLQLLQRQQRRLRPYLLSVRGGVQSAGLRQVCANTPSSLPFSSTSFAAFLSDYGSDVPLSSCVDSVCRKWAASLWPVSLKHVQI